MHFLDEKRAVSRVYLVFSLGQAARRSESKEDRFTYVY